MSKEKNGQEAPWGAVPPVGSADSPPPQYPDPELEGSLDLGDERLPPIQDARKPSRRPKPSTRDPHAGYAEGLLQGSLKHGVTPPDDAAVERDCPLLWQMLTLSLYADRTERVLPTITINRIDGGYKVVLQDHASRKQLVVKVLSLGLLAASLEQAMRRGYGAWEEYKSKKVTNTHKRKKEDGTWTKG